MNSRRYVTPLAFKTAVDQRVRAEAARTGTEMRRLRQLIIFDRYLARLVTVFGERIVLKGGLVLELRLDRARATKDIDLRLLGHPDDTLDKMQKAGRLDMGDFLTYEVRIDPRHPVIEAEGMLYEGRRYRAEASLAGKLYGSVFGVDVAFAEPLLGEPEILEGSRFLSFAGIEATRIRAYPIETHLAEKLHAYSVPRAHPNSRVKDLPDMGLLGTVRPIDGGGLRMAIEQTFQHRGTHPVPAHLPAPPDEWGPIYDRMARSDRLRWATLAGAVAAVQAFLDPVLAGNAGQWDPPSWTWR